MWQNGVSMERHIRELVSIYGSGPLVLVNLIDKKKDQVRPSYTLTSFLHSKNQISLACC